MVSVGRMLMSEARLYLIDEPSLGLAQNIATRDGGVMGASCVGGDDYCRTKHQPLDRTADRILGMHAGRMRGDIGHVELS